ncbi:MAG: DnaJ domain-containing protein [Desulfovibrio sp.]|nr:DnaJ domain-containing protein [Desulfovibrio sp.]
MRHKTRKISLKECYAVLNLAKDANLEDVKHAYRVRAFELHPDLHPDDPLAGKRFQQLNEAYVALSGLLKAQGQQEEDEKTEGKADAKAEETSQAQSESQAEEPRQAASQAQQKRREQADRAYAEQDVLRDLLNDPFARRVFEDIYRELNRQQAGKKTEDPQPSEQKPPNQPKNEQPKPQARKKEPERTQTSLHKDNIAWDTPKWEKQKGVGGFVKNWFKRQIDEEIHLSLPAQTLLPGRKVRLQIRHGLSSDVHTIEVTLPKDFAIGKPVRLRGLGKHVGPWQGDLYLILESSS